MPAGNRSGRSRALRVVLGIVGVLFAAVLVVVIALAANWKRALPYLITSTTGREFVIRGPGHLRILTWHPHLVLEDVTFGNAPWSKQKEMVEVGRFRIGLALRRLLHGQIVFPRLMLDRAIVRLEAQKDGTNNWTLWPTKAATPDDRTEVPAIKNVMIRSAHLTYFRQGAPESDIDLQLSQARGTVAANVRLDARGRYQKMDARLLLNAGSIAALHDEKTPFPLEVSLTAGDTSATIKGHLRGPLDQGGLDVQMNIKGTSMAKLFPLIGVVLPDSPPYSLAGRLEHETRTWRYRDFNGKMGDSDLSGDLAVTLGGKRPMMTADFRSKNLDFDDLAGLVGAPPSAKPGETASAEQKAEVAQQVRSGLVLPDTPIDVPRLQAMDIDARLRADHVNPPNHLPIDKLDLKFLLKDGVLQAAPAAFDVANGRVELNATLHADGGQPRVDGDMKARGVRIARILGDTPFTDETHGSLGGQIKLVMHGRSVREMAATADGSIRLALADARVSHLLVELAGLDVMQSLGVVLRGDEPIPVRCAAFDLTAKNGDVRSNMFVIDTDDTNITADVHLNLATEKLDMSISPHPKDVSLLALRQRLRVEGRLANLDYYPDPLRLGPVGGFMEKVDYLLAPIVGLLTPFDIGIGDKDDNGCAAFLKDHTGGNPELAAAAKAAASAKGADVRTPPARKRPGSGKSITGKSIDIKKAFSKLIPKKKVSRPEPAPARPSPRESSRARR